MSLIHSQKYRPQIIWKPPAFLRWRARSGRHLTLWVGSQLSAPARPSPSSPLYGEGELAAPGDNLPECRTWVSSCRREKRAGEQRRGERPKGVQGPQKQKVSVCIRGVWEKEANFQQHQPPVSPPSPRRVAFPSSALLSHPRLPSLAAGAPPGQGGSGETSSPSTCTPQPVVH